jgi:hypothetical protein
MMLGFFCHTRHEFDTLCVQLENVSTTWRMNIYRKLK